MKLNWKYGILLAAIIPMVLAAVTFAPSMRASASPGNEPNPTQNIPVTGTVTGVGTFNGTLSLVSFAQGTTNNVIARGILNGQVRDESGHVVQTITNAYVDNIPVGFGSAGSPNGVAIATTCNILHLTLGPLDLNLLGLQIHLNQVVLDITAHGGPGNLLGNLLCAVANLLNQSPSPLDQVVALLNQILVLLG
jgi:hypothetical protein